MGPQLARASKNKEKWVRGTEEGLECFFKVQGYEGNKLSLIKRGFPSPKALPEMSKVRVTGQGSWNLSVAAMQEEKHHTCPPGKYFKLKNK